MSFPLGNRLRFQVLVGAVGDVATQIASDLRPRVEGVHSGVEEGIEGMDHAVPHKILRAKSWLQFLEAP